MLDKWIPTTKLCPDCGKLLDLSLADRTVECSCGHVEDRDIHSAKNMIVIAKACFENQSVPTEHREVTLMEFKAAVTDKIFSSKSRRGSEKMLGL